MGENFCIHCGRADPCKSGLHGQAYVEMEAFYWKMQAERFKSEKPPEATDDL